VTHNTGWLILKIDLLIHHLCSAAGPLQSSRAAEDGWTTRPATAPLGCPPSVAQLARQLGLGPGRTALSSSPIPPPPGGRAGQADCPGSQSRSESLAVRLSQNQSLAESVEDSRNKSESNSVRFSSNLSESVRIKQSDSVRLTQLVISQNQSESVRINKKSDLRS
jgi:hypothetical protein